ncbi:hypothetical protein [Flavobacterium sp.]|uniref:hypothetical protein n=1 Tax=Flavobacterium sp. TaxID=239 RepID=UPI00404785C1
MNNLYFIAFFISLNLFSQTNKSLFIFDKTSKEPVPYCTVLEFKNNELKNGNYSDEKGIVSINFNQNHNYEFACVGYELLRVSKILNDTIFLTQSTIILNEIIVTNSNKQKEIGLNNLKKHKSINSHKGGEFAVYIENENKKKVKIKSVLLDISKKKNFTTVLKIKFYRKNANNEPDILLNNKDIIYYLKEKCNGTIEINIDNENIELPEEGVFLGVECLGFIDRNGNFIDDREMWNSFRFLLVDSTKNSTFSKNNLHSNLWFNELKERFNEIGIKYNNYPNIAFGLKIYE